MERRNVELDPNIKYIIKQHLKLMLEKISDTPDYMILQYVTNLLNLCSTLDEIVYVTPDELLNKCFGPSIKRNMFKPSERFKETVMQFKSEFEYEEQKYKQLLLKYFLLK